MATKNARKRRRADKKALKKFVDKETARFLGKSDTTFDGLHSTVARLTSELDNLVREDLNRGGSKLPAACFSSDLLPGETTAQYFQRTGANTGVADDYADALAYRNEHGISKEERQKRKRETYGWLYGRSNPRAEIPLPPLLSPMRGFYFHDESKWKPRPQSCFEVLKRKPVRSSAVVHEVNMRLNVDTSATTAAIKELLALAEKAEKVTPAAPPNLRFEDEPMPAGECETCDTFGKCICWAEGWNGDDGPYNEPDYPAMVAAQSPEKWAAHVAGNVNVMKPQEDTIKSRPSLYALNSTVKNAILTLTFSNGRALQFSWPYNLPFDFAEWLHGHTVIGVRKQLEEDNTTTTVFQSDGGSVYAFRDYDLDNFHDELVWDWKSSAEECLRLTHMVDGAVFDIIEAVGKLDAEHAQKIADIAAELPLGGGDEVTGD